MSFLNYFSAILCVIGLSAGQILFKYSAKYISDGLPIYALKPLAYLLSAFILYGITSIAWVYILQKIQLGKVYPIMALAFVFVPIGSFLFFGEKFTIQYSIGVTFIVIGILVSTSSN